MKIEMDHEAARRLKRAVVVAAVVGMAVELHIDAGYLPALSFVYR